MCPQIIALHWKEEHGQSEQEDEVLFPHIHIISLRVTATVRKPPGKHLLWLDLKVRAGALFGDQKYLLLWKSNFISCFHGESWSLSCWGGAALPCGSGSGWLTLVSVSHSISVWIRSGEILFLQDPVSLGAYGGPGMGGLYSDLDKLQHLGIWYIYVFHFFLSLDKVPKVGVQG